MCVAPLTLPPPPLPLQDTEVSHMTKLRNKEHELSMKCAPLEKQAHAAFKVAIDSFNVALELWISSLNSVTGHADISTGVEIYYNRARCWYMMNEFPDAIKDLNRVIKITPNHVPSLMLRGSARMDMGQYPQARRDFAKICNRCEEEGTKAWKAADELKEECDEGVICLSHAGICKPDDERTFEVTSEGVRIRDRVAVRKLGEFGRSLKKKHMDDIRNKKKEQVDLKKMHDDGREGELKHAHSRADIARRKVEKCRGLREKYTAARVEAEKKALEDKKRKAAEKKKKAEEKREEKERWMMEAEEELIRSMQGAEEEVELKAEEDKVDDEEMEDLLAAAGRGRSRNKKRDDKSDKPWLNSGGGKKKKKAGSKPGTPGGKAGSKPGTPAGSKPGTPAKPKTPAK